MSSSKSSSLPAPARPLTPSVHPPEKRAPVWPALVVLYGWVVLGACTILLGIIVGMPLEAMATAPLTALWLIIAEKTRRRSPVAPRWLIGMALFLFASTLIELGLRPAVQLRPAWAVFVGLSLQTLTILPMLSAARRIAEQHSRARH